jgi:hypothetical protein
MYTCPCCYAMSSSTSPHGSGQPCPTGLTLRQAEIDERVAHRELMEAQTQATIVGARKAARRTD